MRPGPWTLAAGMAVLCLVPASSPGQPAAAPAASRPQAGPAADLDLFCTWITGAFDNFQQVTEQRENKVPEPHQRLHAAISPLAAPHVGDRVFLVRESRPDDPHAAGHAHVYSVTAAAGTIVMRVYAFRDPHARAGTPADPAGASPLPADALRAVEGCDATWTREGDAFVGTVRSGACRIPAWPATRTPVTLTNTWRLTADTLALTTKAVDDTGAVVLSQPGDLPFVLRRARPFTCWAALRKDGSADQYDGWRHLAVHNQGSRVPMPPEAGENAKFAFELSELRYSQQLPVLKLAIYETGNPQAVAYTWTEPEGRRIGINLRWVQVGCTARD